ncbi:DUF2189 domain-containing protein [Methylibium sp.]|uniref:DUF2189 domain-containing protein n=1 Tax=Methylibium sp. TaxID=2067992 RepID=UPI003D0A7578
MSGIGLGAPFDWLARGWRDFRTAPAVGVAHGALCAAFGIALFAFAHQRFWVLAGAVSGFLLVAPVVATGLYAVSRAIERGETPDAACVLRVWRSLDRRLVAFGVGLAAAGTGWVLTSAALITLFAPAPIATPLDFLRHVVVARSGWLFEGWLLLGGLLAAPVFASSVIAIPLLLDRPSATVRAAVLASWRAVLAQPLPLALWAALVMTLSAAGMVAAMLGLLAVVPLLGHASWHAYRALAGADARVVP